MKALWDTVLPFAGYAFNKSHAAGYGLVSYWTAYLKANYPAEYMAGLLTSVGDDKDKAAVYLADCRKLGITVLPPDVNESLLNFASVGADIRFGLGAVRNVGANVVGSLIKTRSDKGKFTDFSDYLNKIEVGGLQQEGHRVADQGGRVRLAGVIPARACSWSTPTPSTRCSAPRRPRRSGQFDLFGGADTATDAVFTIKVPEDEWDDKHKLALEREMLGLYVSGHPLNGVAHLLSAQVDTADSGHSRRRRRQRRPRCVVGGILASVNRRVNKNGMPWASAQLEDLTGGIEVLFFPQTYSVYGAEIADDAVVLVKAKVAVARRPDLADRTTSLWCRTSPALRSTGRWRSACRHGNAPSTKSARSSRCWPATPAHRRCTCG